MRQTVLAVVVVAIALMPVRAQSPGAAGALAQLIAHTDPSAYRPLSRPRRRRQHVVHGATQSRRADARVQSLHRGVIPAGPESAIISQRRQRRCS
jgi:hypothetical protein